MINTNWYVVDENTLEIGDPWYGTTWSDYFEIGDEIIVEQDDGPKLFNVVSINGTYLQMSGSIDATKPLQGVWWDDLWKDGVTPLTLVINDTRFNFEGLIAGDLGANGFSKENSYDIVVTVKDKLETVDSGYFRVFAGKPTMALNRYGASVNAPYDESLGEGFQVTGKLIVNEVEVAINEPYPVGSIYMSVNDTNPSNYFGGTWVAWGTGRVPVGIDTSDTDFNTVEKTGGAKTHTLTVGQMPKHRHNFIGARPSGNIIFNQYYVGGQISTLRPDILAIPFGSGGVSESNVYLAEMGNDEAHNNIQPYITCYMWKRTA